MKRRSSMDVISIWMLFSLAVSVRTIKGINEETSQVKNIEGVDLQEDNEEAMKLGRENPKLREDDEIDDDDDSDICAENSDDPACQENEEDESSII